MVKNHVELVSAEVLNELHSLGNKIYETHIKMKVEPQFDNQYIAIHVDSEDFEIGKSTGTATRALLKRHPADGRMYVRKIGRELEFGLIARLLSGDLLTELSK